MNQTAHFFRTTGLALALSAAALSPAWAASHQGGQPAPTQPAAQVASADMASAEVRKVDKAGGKLTLKHGEIKNLDMPPMTMVFVVKDKALLDTLKAGDKIRFKASNEAGKYTVTELQMAP